MQAVKPLDVSLHHLFAQQRANNAAALSASNANTISIEPSTEQRESSVEDARRVLKQKLHSLTAQEIYQLAERDKDQRASNVEQSYGAEPEPAQSLVSQVTRRVNQGLKENESTVALSQMMDKVSQGAIAAHEETRNLLQSLGALSLENDDYLNRSESYTRFSLDGLADSVQQQAERDELFEIDKAHKTLELSVTTREGDEVDIKINIAQQWDDLTFGRAVEVSYEVDGDLSRDERDALDGLLNSFSEVSDGFLNGGDLNSLFGLDAFDASELEGFSLNMGGAGQSLNYQYSVDQERQNINLDWSRGDTNVADIKMSSELGGSQDEQRLEQILALLDQAEDTAHDNDQERLKGLNNNTSSNLELFKDSVKTLFDSAAKFAEQLGVDHSQKEQLINVAKQTFNAMSENYPQYQGLDNEDQASLKQGYSTLVDHSISFIDYSGGVLEQREGQSANGFSFSTKQRTQLDEIAAFDEQHRLISQYNDLSLTATLENGKHYIDRGTDRFRHLDITESSYITSAFYDNKLVGLDQGRERSFFEDTLTYTGLGGYARSVDKDKSTSNSEIRILEGLYIEHQQSSRSGFAMRMEYHGAMLDQDSITGTAYAEQKQTLIIIGDLEKLQQDSDYRNEKARELKQLNDFMRRHNGSSGILDEII